jgi:hypothetical protein
MGGYARAEPGKGAQSKHEGFIARMLHCTQRRETLRVIARCG